MLPRVKIISTRKTPVVTQWWIDWNAEKLGPFILERDACRRAADMIEMAWSAQHPRIFVPIWQEMVRWFKPDKTDPVAMSMTVGACRAARDAIVLTVSSAEWAPQLVADALTHAGQWLAPLIGTEQDVIVGDGSVSLFADGSDVTVLCNLSERSFFLNRRPT